MATTTTKNPDGSTTVNDGTYGGSPTAPSTNSTVLDTSSLTPTTTNIPYVPPVQTKTDVMGSVDAAAGSVDSFIKSMTPSTQQPAESTGDTLSKQIAGLIGGTENQAADLAAAEKQQGIDTKLQEMQAAQNNVNMLSAAYKKTYATLWDRNKPIELLSGEQNALKAQAEADIGFAQAEVLAKQGDIETAQTLAKRATDAKYAPTLAAIETKKKQLEALKPLLDKEASIRSAAQTAALEKMKKAEEAKAANEANFAKLKIDASAGGISASTLEKASQAFKDGKEDQAYALLGPYGKEALSRKELQASIAQKWADVAKTNADAASNNMTTSGDFSATVSIVKDFLPANVQKTYVAEVQGMINRGDFKSAYQKVQNAVSKGLQGTTKDEFDAKVVALPAIDNLQKTLEAYVKANGDTSLLKGTANQIEAKLGNVKDPKYAQLATDLQASFQQYRKDVSGAAFGPGESSAYASVNPSEKNNLELNTAILAGMKQNFNRKVDSTVEAMAGSGAKYLKEYATNPSLTQKAAIVSTGNPKADNFFVASSKALVNTTQPSTGSAVKDSDVYSAGYTDNNK